jgi:hypothetical protein
MKTRFYMMLASLMILSFISCQKDTSTVEQAGVNAANDDAVSDAIFDDVYNTADNATIIVDQIAKEGVAKSSVLPDSCPSVTVINPDAGIWPKTITVDYGTECTGLWDNTRSGKIIIVITGPRLDVGSTKTITFDNYYFNGIKVEGTKVIENTGYNANVNLVMAVTLTDGKLTLPDGRTVLRSFSHQREWIAGIQTKNIWDDECLITGTATGTTIEGVAYTNTITTALDWKRVCRFIVSGVVKIQREGKGDIEINYGDGTCDAKAVVTKGNESKEILLHHRMRTML